MSYIKLKNIAIRISRKLFYLFGYFFSIPMAVFVYIFFPFYKIIFVSLFSDRIGHYALNTELMVCSLETNSARRKCFYIFYAKPAYIPLCNSQLHRMWKRVIFIFPFPQIAEQADNILKLLVGKEYKENEIKITFEPTSGANDPNGLLKKIRTPHLKFTKSEIAKGEELSIQLGLPKNTKYICLISRDSEYLKRHLPGIDWSYHNFRNVDIDTFKKAALFLAENGYHVIRMGKFVAKKFDLQHKNIIDYATSSLRSDFMDIYLLSRCYFFISTVTGLDCIPQIFRRPGLFTNVVLPELLLPWYPNKLFIPKKIKNINSQEILSFSKSYNILSKPLNSISLLLSENNLEAVQNTSEEILEVTKEMVALLNENVGTANEENQKLQMEFWYHFPKKSNTNYYIKIGSDFLKSNLI